MNNFLFGDIVVVNQDQLGVVVKTWKDIKTNTYSYEVYNRMIGKIAVYKESEMERYRVRHKYLNEEEYIYQHCE